MGPNRQRRVWFFYDELASLHKLSSLPRIISEARKFGGCFVLGFQNIAQMEEIYGPKAAAGLFDLLNTKFFFRSPSAEIAQFVEKDLGKPGVKSSMNRPASAMSRSVTGFPSARRKSVSRW
jgi:type IV secretory pathway TraG/TraD family ATPase VirD4